LEKYNKLSPSDRQTILDADGLRQSLAPEKEVKGAPEIIKSYADFVKNMIGDDALYRKRKWIVNHLDCLRNCFLSFLVGEATKREILESRPKVRDQRYWLDTKIKIICFVISSLVFILLSILIFLYRREQWFVSVWGILEFYPTIIFGVTVGLLAGLIIGVGLIANLLISYAHSIETKLSFLLKRDSKSTVEIPDWDKDKRDERWKEYNLHIDLYKYYLELSLKANIFFYAITGTIVGFYLTHPEVGYKKVSLLLPIMMSLALGGIFIHGGILWIRVSGIIREIRRELNIKKAPDINLMTTLLTVFGFIFLVVSRPQTLSHWHSEFLLPCAFH
jgi:hypothetical protein